MEVNGNKYWSKKTKPNILKTPPSTKNWKILTYTIHLHLSSHNTCKD
jgi:hypothetical protein